MTMRCCGEMRGLSQPEERVAITRLGLGSMLAVEEERRERALRGISSGLWWFGMKGLLGGLGRAYCCLRWSRGGSSWVKSRWRWLGWEAVSACSSFGRVLVL